MMQEVASPGSPRWNDASHPPDIHQHPAAAGIEKRVYPHLFRYQIITFLTRKGIISSKLQLLSGHAEEKKSRDLSGFGP